MFPPKSLGLALVVCVSATAAACQSLSNLRDDCEFTADRSRYDLCPLFHDRGQEGVVKVRAELTPNTQLLYEISFDGPLSAQNGEEFGPQVSNRGGYCASRNETDDCFSALRERGFV